MELQVNDYFRYRIPKFPLKLNGQIIEITDKFYRFRIINSNRKELIGRTAIFQRDGKIINQIERISEEESKEDLNKR